MIFLGQTIEHITRKDVVNKLFPLIKNCLKEDGFFIFDTPNREITGIQAPNSFIDDDHKHEYNPDELEQILDKNGFEVIEKWGLIPMPDTFDSKKWDPDEPERNAKIVNYSKGCYIFAFKCKIKK